MSDRCNYNSSNPCLYVGGNYNNQSRNYGLFYSNSNSTSNTNTNIGSRTQNMTWLVSYADPVRGAVVAHPSVKICHIRGGLVLPTGRRKDRTAKLESIYMKRANNLYEKMVSEENIRRAIEQVNKSHRWLKGHRPNRTVAWIETTMEERITELRGIVEDGFHPTKPTVKRRYDRNAKKWRNIAEPRLYPDQYIHHILIQVLEPVMMRGMDPYCCGSIKGRGTHHGVRSIKRWMKNDRKGTRWCAELDIYHFYEQLSPEVVMNRMKCLVKDRRVLDLIERCLEHGVTIGAYTSQWFANTVLQPLDVLIRENGASHYLRYMDNFTIFTARKKTIIRIIKEAKRWLKEHGLRLKGTWQYFRTKVRTPNALGYRYGRDYTLIRKGRLLSIKRQIRSYYRSKREVSVKFAVGLLSRLSGLIYCNNRNIYKRFVPNGLQRRLKDIARTNRKEELLWSTFLESYSAMAM